ncbi:MAG: xanthan lyase, partial [Muribaculaceae bacterium]|nr:xanthan lyase [Muribaculaceae bacterium]
MLPHREGLGIPVDLSFAFHSDAGTTMNDDIIGTLGIYSTAGDTLGNGSSRLASRDLTDLVMTNIVDDVRAKYEPAWTRRGMWDKSYFEAREPAVPAMLLELLSHQNFADMKYGLDPRFRFDVSRAVYKGMLQFIAHRDGRPYVVQPLAVNSFAINSNGDGRYTLCWKATPDSLEASAMPTYYIIEERIADGPFRQVGRCTEPRFDISVSDSEIHSYRIIAGNDGGVSFPGETLALCYRKDMPEVLVINGFTRLGAPYWFDSGDIAGFYNAYDSGVADGHDIGFIGEQMEFRREIPWMDDDAAGFGASRSVYETRVIAGNTFDYPFAHGQLIAAAGYSFTSTSMAAWLDGSCGSDAKVIDIIFGKQRESAIGRGVKGTEFKTFTPEVQARIKVATEAGTSFLISGSYVASDLWDNPNSSEAVRKSDMAFAKDVLGYQWRSGQAAIEGEACTVQNPFGIQRGITLTFNQRPDEDIYPVESPDGLFPADERGATFMRYCE